ncbi:IS110 family transposase [Citrobacter cronae]|nr:IS110 family transposase [Citrobacter cronae]
MVITQSGLPVTGSEGVDKMIAISLVSEMGDFSHFPNPRQIMAYIGLISGKHSSGKKIRSLRITKTGNSELRRLLYKAAWAYRSSPKAGSWLITNRPAAATQKSKDIVWKAQQKLYTCYKTLIQKK